MHNLRWSIATKMAATTATVRYKKRSVCVRFSHFKYGKKLSEMRDECNNNCLRWKGNITKRRGKIWIGHQWCKCTGGKAFFFFSFYTFDFRAIFDISHRNHWNSFVYRFIDPNSVASFSYIGRYLIRLMPFFSSSMISLFGKLEIRYF